MTNSPRRTAFIPLFALIAAIPWLLAARDPLDEARQRLASMTSGQRKMIERNRDAYDKLSSFEQYELRELSDALAKLPPNERAELEATMGRLAAWVATFPDDVRAEYDKAMPSGRIEILNKQLAEWKKRDSRIVAEVAKAEREAKKATQPVGPRARVESMMRLHDLVENRVRISGTSDERELLKLVNQPMTLKPQEKWIVLGCLAAQKGTKPPRKKLADRFESPADHVPLGLLHSLDFVPAFKRLPNDPRGGLPEANRDELMRVLPQLYLLTPPEKRRNHEDLMDPLNVPMQFRPHPSSDNVPEYLLNQLALLKKYADGEKSPPIRDYGRVKKLLEK